MRRIGYGLIFLVMFCFLFTGCASFKPVDITSQYESGKMIQKTDNFIVLFDKSASMRELHGTPMVNQASRLTHGKDVTKNMIAATPDIKLKAGLRSFWDDKTLLLYGMKPLEKVEYTKAVNSIEFVLGRTPMGQVITEGGNDLKGEQGYSAMIIVSDFSDLKGIDDIRRDNVMEAITKVNADFGDRLCVYAVQVGYTANGKELAEKVVQNVEGGYTVNADKLAKPAAMAAFVEKVITHKCEHYAKVQPREKIVVTADEPLDESKLGGGQKVVVLSFEDIHFDFDKSTLKPEAKALLKKNIQMLKDNPNAKIRVAGYTSASGTDAYNQGLSERRASAVQEYLVSEGIISRDRLSTIGYGEADPAMYEASPKQLYSKEAKANMRVLFEVIVK